MFTMLQSEHFILQDSVQAEGSSYQYNATGNPVSTYWGGSHPPIGTRASSARDWFFNQRFTNCENHLSTVVQETMKSQQVSQEEAPLSIEEDPEDQSDDCDDIVPLCRIPISQ